MLPPDDASWADAVLGPSDAEEPAWRVRHEGVHGMYYEERYQGAWHRLALDSEVQLGQAHHLVRFGPVEAWAETPEWAHGRRDEIVRRIKRACPIPDYEYWGEGVLDDDDRRVLIELAGGVSEDACAWAGCTERALRSKALCVNHANRHML